MNTYWKVVTKFYDNGRVKCSIHQIEAETLPESSFEEKKTHDEYVDYFTTYTDANAFLQDARKA